MKNKNLIKTNALFLATAILATTSVYAATVVNTDVKATNAVVNSEVKTKLKIGEKESTTTKTGVSIHLGDDGMEDGTMDVESTGTMHTMDIGDNDGEVMLSAGVKSDNDLDMFATNIRAKHTEVADVDFKNENEGKGEVTVKYEHKGKLFWLFPVSVESETHVYSDANSQAVVDTSLSWWSFLVSGINYDKAKLETSIKNDETVKSNVSVNASATAKAAVAESVVAKLQANATMEAK